MACMAQASFKLVMHLSHPSAWKAGVPHHVQRLSLLCFTFVFWDRILLYPCLEGTRYVVYAGLELAAVLLTQYLVLGL